MHLGEVSILNFKCFQGRHDLALEPKAYSVTARRAEDPESSNWAGKSTLLEAVRFCLYGDHDSETEDGWITHGEPAGQVSLALVGDGATTIVLRARARGKATRLSVAGPGKQLTGAEAQGYLDVLMGLSPKDFLHTSYFKQRQMARMVLARPQERMDIVTEWLRLDRLAEGEQVCRLELSDLSTRHAEVVREASSAREAREASRGEHASLAAMRGAESDLAAEVLVLRKDLDSLVRQVEQGRELAATRVRVEQYDRLTEGGKRLAETVRGYDLPKLTKAEEEAGEAETAAAVELSRATAAENGARQVAQGQFDGVCPVANIQCPAKSQINDMGTVSRRALASATEVAKAARRKHQEVQATFTTARARHQEALREKARLDAMREQIQGFHPEYKRAKARMEKAGDPVDVERRMVALSHEVEEKAARLQRLRAGIEDHGRASAREEKANLALEEKAKELADARAAVSVFQQARRRVSELAMRDVEDGANALLRECGIDLSLRVRWEREGDGLSRACDACGAPFPASARVKSCERCGEARGQHQVRRLELVLSNRSGAAEDLAGAAFQLSAGAWLRRDRGSAWSVALLDECFSQMDVPNRKAFATHLVSMLSGRYGFRQSFVISHTADTVAMVPGRIEITSEGGRAKVRVA